MMPQAERKAAWRAAQKALEAWSSDAFASLAGLQMGHLEWDSCRETCRKKARPFRRPSQPRSISEAAHHMQAEEAEENLHGKASAWQV